MAFHFISRCVAGLLAGVAVLLAGVDASGQAVTIEELQREFYSLFPRSPVMASPAAAAAPLPNPYAIIEREYLFAYVRSVVPAGVYPRLNRIREQTPSIVRTYASCVKVITPRWHGSGILVSPAGDVLTCYHLVAGAPTATVQSIDGKIHPVSGISAFSAVHDLAVIRIAGGPFACAPPTLSTETPRAGDPVFALGHPVDGAWVLTAGRVVRWQQDNATRLLHYEADISRGYSGGPVVDAAGRLLAVTAYAARLANGSHVKVGIAADEVQRFLGAAAAPLHSFAALEANLNNHCAIDFLERMYGVGEDFMDELRRAMSQVSIESLSRRAAKPASAPGADAARPERVAVRNMAPCADVAAKLLLLRQLAGRCLSLSLIEGEVSDSALQFQAAIDRLLDSVYILDQTRGATTVEARQALERIRGLTSEAHASLALALSKLQNSAVRYDRPLMNPEGFKRIRELRIKYNAPDPAYPGPGLDPRA